MARYWLGPGIQRRIDGIWQELARRHSEGAANDTVARLEEVFELLAAQPGMGVPGECAGKPLRRFLAGNYWVYYRVPEQGVLITKLSHVRQNQAQEWDATLR